jgi:UDP-N-acetylmuramoyl-tripeptide--D-alanyl-D-alanine ligase
MIKKTLKTIIVKILTWEARLVLKKYKPKIIAVTGSIGKTGTKDMISHVLSGHVYTHKSLKSYNSELGVPLTVLMEETGWRDPLLWLKNIFRGLSFIFLKSHYPEYLVLEVGVDRPKDMKNVTSFIKPDIAVFTKLSSIPPHVEFFKDKEALYKEKFYLANAVKKGGVLIVNKDDPEIMRIKDSYKEGREVVSFGFGEGADIRASDEHIKYVDEHPKGISFKVNAYGNVIPVFIPGTIGEGYIYSALAALAVARALSVNLVKATASISEFHSPPGRMKILDGINKSIIIDDSYNASPDAMVSSIRMFKKLKNSGKKILVLGDMLELGKETVEAHQKMGEEFSGDISSAYLVGPRARFMAEGKKKGGLKANQIYFVSGALEAGTVLSKKLKEGDAVLVKGSQGIRLEKTVEKILRDPEKKKEFLVRQEIEWKNR